MLIGAEGRCPHCIEPVSGSFCTSCGKSPDDICDVQYARAGTVVGGRYLLGACVRKNGEGALYAGLDKMLQQKVWVREYFPQTIAQRDIATGRINPLSGCGAQYKALMSDFVDSCNEVRRLSVTEQVVPLENAISENNTVYAVYKGLDLVSFEDYLEEQGGMLGFRQAYALLQPICNTLELLHSHGQVHRGISPYSIYMGPDGKLYLWDFALGATRTAGSELDSELFSGYSAPEQYSPNGWQGSWTDVYAMGALFYRTLTGVVPPKSIRIDKEQNQLARPSELQNGLSEDISRTIMAAMFPTAEDRLQTVQTFLSRMVEQRPASTSVYDLGNSRRANANSEPHKKPPPRRPAPVKQETREEPSVRPQKQRERGGSTFKYVVLGTLIMLVVLLGVLYYFMTTTIWDILGGGAGPAPDPDYEYGYYVDPPVENVPVASVPNFVGRQFSDFENDPDYLERFTFDARFERRPERQGGEVYDQSPDPGSPMPSAEPIRIVLWINLEDVEMPELVGLPLEEATALLAELEILEPQTLTRISTEPEGTVLQTVPEEGAMLSPARDTVVLIVSVQPEITQGAHDPSPGGGGGTLLPPGWQHLSPAEFAQLSPEQQAAVLAAQRGG
ncbi:MAG: PASTA domain-containing protein [Oscillospiraceae bacterium]|nr:PASTA domain-containing protein [Oscillospiraceae bacterium]